MTDTKTEHTPGPAEGFKFDRRGEIKGDPRHAHVLFHGMLGEVRDQYRDEDETIRLRVTYLNGEPWPLDPPAGCVAVLKREWEK